MIFLDSDIFLIDLRYRCDQKYNENTAFLSRLREPSFKRPGFTLCKHIPQPLEN